MNREPSGSESSVGETANGETASDGRTDPTHVADDRTDGAWTPSWLVALRRRPRQRRVALVVAALVGLAAAWLHWLGLVVAGALVGFVSETVRRALAAALVVGVATLAAHVAVAPAMSVGEFLALTPPAYVTVAAAVVGPLWGSLVRGVV